MRNVAIGVGLGAVAGTLDVIPMVLQGLSWDADLSAFTMWVVIGLFVATTKLDVHPVLHGLLVAFACLAPTAVLIGAAEPFALLPISMMTLILGSSLGWAVRSVLAYRSGTAAAEGSGSRR